MDKIKITKISKELRHVYFPVTTIKELEKIAEADCREVNNLIMKIVVEYVKNHEKEI